MLKATRVVVLILSLSLLSGCVLAWMGVGAGLGVGTYRYLEGAVEGDYRLAYDAAWDVTNKVLADNNISITESTNDGGRGKIQAVRKDGKSITIRVQYKLQDVTTINIRVGIIGDIESAEKLHSQIHAAARPR